MKQIFYLIHRGKNYSYSVFRVNSSLWGFICFHYWTRLHDFFFPIQRYLITRNFNQCFYLLGHNLLVATWKLKHNVISLPFYQSISIFTLPVTITWVGNCNKFDTRLQSDVSALKSYHILLLTKEKKKKNNGKIGISIFFIHNGTSSFLKLNSKITTLPIPRIHQCINKDNSSSQDLKNL